MKKLIFPAVICCTLLSSLNGMELSEALRIDSFGTFGVSTNDSKKIRFKPYKQIDGIGHGEYDFTSNTLFGLQGSYQISDSLSTAAQGLVSYEGDDKWKNKLEWAYLHYDTEYGAAFRLGKFRVPIFQSSELAYVGYARIQTRPPVEFYGAGGYEHLFGAQINYGSSINDYDLLLRSSYGYADDDTPTRSDGSFDSVESKNVKIVSARFGNHYFFVNISYTDFTSDFTAFRAKQPSLHRGYTQLKMWGAEWQFRYAGAVLDGGYAKGEVSQFQPDEEIYYSTLSYQLNAFTPYINFSGKAFKNLKTPPSIDPNRKPPDESKTRDHIFSIGCRYELMDGAAIKLQWDRIDAAPSNGSSSINQTGANGVHNALSLTMDWMF